MKRGPIACHSACIATLLLATSPAPAQSIVPPPRPVSPIVRQLMQDDFRTDEERRSLHRFHGTWDDEDLRDPAHLAEVALLQWQLDAPVLGDADVPAEIRAEAAMRRGDSKVAMRLLAFRDSIPALSLRGRLLLDLGLDDEAEEVLAETMQREPQSARDQVARVAAGRTYALLTGRTGDAYQSLMNTLAETRSELDPLYWPAILAEAELLFEKLKINEAIEALWEVLELNPRCSDAWYLLGRISILAFQFESTERAVETLRRIHPDHPLAHLLEAEAALIRRDHVRAIEALEPVLDRFPSMPRARSLHMAALALGNDHVGLERARESWQASFPGNPLAATQTGRILAHHRQFEDADRWLREAIAVQPNWPKAHVELGLMRWQAGDDEAAHAALQEAVDLDPFNLRAANSLDLLNEIRGYESLESEHFVIRYSPGVDEALVRDMPDRLEEIHERVAGRFDWEPDRRTVIEILPDHERFAVRIIGLPDIHTMAACTGPVIAMEVPRRMMPRRHMGTWDWEHVLEHEYTHTITLDRTANRIPLWLTEGLAVAMEPTPRTWSTRRMLADEWAGGTMLEPGELNWAFLRPRRPQDRDLAYSQSWMMVQFMEDAYGEAGLQRLLDQYRDGVHESTAFPAALGVTRERFQEDFLEWAGHRIREWGLAPEPSMNEMSLRAIEQGDEQGGMLQERRRSAIREGMRRVMEDVALPSGSGRVPAPGGDWQLPDASDFHDPDEAQIDGLLEIHPGHAGLLELAVLDQVRNGSPMDEVALDRLQQYVAARPGDPMGHRLLASYWMQQGMPDRAIEHFEALASFASNDPGPAMELAKALRKADRHDEALEAMRRTVSIDPYDPELREYTAAMAIEAGDLETALLQVEALLILEPGQPRHQQRLEAIRRRMNAP